MRKNTLIFCLALIGTLLSGCGTSHGFDNGAVNASLARNNSPSTPIENPAFWQGNPETVWAQLQQTPLDKLEANQTTPDVTNAAWIKLAIISKRYSVDTKELAAQLIAWRAQYPDHPGNKLFPSNSTLNDLNSNPPKNIALLLPLTGKFASLGKATRSGFLNAYYQNFGKPGASQSIAFYDTNSANVTTLYQQAVSKGATVVVGPLTKENVKQLVSSGNISVPTLALNYTDSWGSLPNNLYQFGLSPLDETKQIADKAAETGHKRAIIIAPQTDWGQMVVKNLVEHWQADGGKVVDTYFFTPQANLAADIPHLLHINPKEDRAKSVDQEDKTTLEQQRRQDFDVLFLLAPPQAARQIVPLLKYYYVEKTPIYATSVVYSGAPQPQKDSDLNGVYFCEIPWTLSKSSAAGIEIGAGSNRLFAVGRDAYYISHDLERFTTLPNFPFYGATGEITLTPQKQFYRRLAWAQFHGGQP